MPRVAARRSTARPRRARYGMARGARGRPPSSTPRATEGSACGRSTSRSIRSPAPPRHMDVLLSEAGVPYDLVPEMTYQSDFVKNRAACDRPTTSSTQARSQSFSALSTACLVLGCGRRTAVVMKRGLRPVMPAWKSALLSDEHANAFGDCEEEHRWPRGGGEAL